LSNVGFRWSIEDWKDKYEEAMSSFECETSQIKEMLCKVVALILGDFCKLL